MKTEDITGSKEGQRHSVQWFEPYLTQSRIYSLLASGRVLVHNSPKKREGDSPKGGIPPASQARSWQCQEVNAGRGKRR